MNDYVEVKVRKDLYDKAVKYIEEVGGFSNVEELIEFLLSEVVSSESGAGIGSYSEEDEEKIKERLKSLGYL